MAIQNQNMNQSFKQIEGESWLSTYLPALSAGIVMAIVLFLAISCSRKSDNPATRIKAPEAPIAENGTSAAAPALPPAPAKKAKRHRPANATYINSAYGVSFSYPRRYSLQSGTEKSPLPVATAFVKPGAVEIAAVDIPETLYTDTDFSSGLLNVSVNESMTDEECSKFADLSGPKAVTDKAAEGGVSPKPDAIKLGSNQFTVSEQMAGQLEHQSDLKYFHLFKNGACYEFALDVETSRKPDEDLAQVDRGKVFQQLAKIVTSARIKEVQLPGVESAQKSSETAKAPEVAGSETKPVQSNSSATKVNPTGDNTAQVVTPQPK